MFNIIQRVLTALPSKIVLIPRKGTTAKIFTSPIDILPSELHKYNYLTNQSTGIVNIVVAVPPEQKTSLTQNFLLIQIRI